MNANTDVIVIGGGLAGLTTALHLSKLGFSITLIEKNSYPHHKVCGEYLSAEVIPYLEWLEADVRSLTPIRINRLLFTTNNGRETYAKLPLGGLGISRYALDEFLYKKVLLAGCEVIHDAVARVSLMGSVLEIQLLSGRRLSSTLVIGAYGKRSAIDQKLKRDFINKRSPWLAVKAHYDGEWPNDLVALHHFKGGYCGVSKIEDGKINICYLADYHSFKKHKSIGTNKAHIDTYQRQVLYSNPHLKKLMEQSRMTFEQPLTISQIAFGEKEMVQDHMLMVGDAAGLIHPLSGNGMAMAIHGAKICAELISEHLHPGECLHNLRGRLSMENEYKKRWQQAFRSRLQTSSMLSGILSSSMLTSLSISGLKHLPFLLPVIIRKTHGHLLIPEA